MERKGCNATVQIQSAFYPLTANLAEHPALVEVIVQGDGWKYPLTLSLSQFKAKEIQKQCPLLRFQNRKAQAVFDESLITDLLAGLKDGTIQRGYLFDKGGANILPDGRLCFVHGSELLGVCGRPYRIAPQISGVRLRGNGEPLSRLLPLLEESPPQVLLVLAHIVLTTIRSLLVEDGIDLQAVLYIVGGQGLGKTTLATRVAGIYEKDGKPAGIVQAGSTYAAVNALMTGLRDQPVIIDDLCLSVSRDTARKRVELASKLIRQGTGCIPIIKQTGKTTVELPCEAGLILTAEFPLKNLSDLTRCIIVPVKKPLNIPDELTPELIGNAIRHYSRWFTEHYQEELPRFRNIVDHAVEGAKADIRMATNYACLKAAFLSFLRSLCSLGVPARIGEPAISRMDRAILKATKEHQSMMEQIKETIPLGNLSYCIMEGYKANAFQLAEKKKDLSEKDGILWQNDLCLRREALIRFVRLQPGYQNWSSNRITRALKDIGALVLQEENAATVRLSNKANVPRVYRIRLSVLKETAKKY